jgi:hypothetical protein
MTDDLTGKGPTVSDRAGDGRLARLLQGVGRFRGSHPLAFFVAGRVGSMLVMLFFLGLAVFGLM